MTATRWRQCYECREPIPAGTGIANDRGLRFCTEECKEEYES